MRANIEITDAQSQRLRNFAFVYPEMLSKIERAIQYRARVLEIYDKLAGTVASHKEIKPEEMHTTPAMSAPLTREEIASMAHLLSPEQYAMEMEKAAR